MTVIVHLGTGGSSLSEAILEWHKILLFATEVVGWVLKIVK